MDAQTLVDACRAVSVRYGDDVSQDVAVTLLEWERRGTLQPNLPLKYVALLCGKYRVQQLQRSSGEARTIVTTFGAHADAGGDIEGISLDRITTENNSSKYVNSTTEETLSYLVRSESVADRMEFCALKKLLCDPANQKVIRHALGDPQYSRERYSQKLRPFVEGGYLNKKLAYKW